MNEFNEIVTVFKRQDAVKARQLELDGKAEIIPVHDFPNNVPTYSDGSFEFEDGIGVNRAYFAVRFKDKETYDLFEQLENK